MPDFWTNSNNHYHHLTYGNLPRPSLDDFKADDRHAFFTQYLSLISIRFQSRIPLILRLFVCGISLTSGQLINELFPDCRKVMLLISQVVLCRMGSACIYEMRRLFVAAGPNARPCHLGRQYKLLF